MSWYAFYTRSRAEKSATALLREQGIEAYLPLQSLVHQWSDRKKTVEVPLIRGYVFARPTPEQYLKVLNTKGIVCCVYHCGKPAVIPEEDILTLKAVVSSRLETESRPQTFVPGQKVRFTNGPLEGRTGILTRISGKNKVALRIEPLDLALLVTVSPGLLEILSQSE